MLLTSRCYSAPAALCRRESVRRPLPPSANHTCRWKGYPKDIPALCLTNRAPPLYQKGVRGRRGPSDAPVRLLLSWPHTNAARTTKHNRENSNPKTKRNPPPRRPASYSRCRRRQSASAQPPATRRHNAGVGRYELRNGHPARRRTAEGACHCLHRSRRIVRS
jgi:hypothetical protein